MPPSLSVVVPAYNEGSRLGRTLVKIFAYLNDEGYEAEVIVVDDGSPDNTAQVAEESFVHAGNVGTTLLRNDVNRGKGYSVRRGLLASSKEIAIFSDADLSTPIEETPKLLTALSQGVDIAFGSRALDRSLIGIHQSWRREQGGKVFNTIVRLSTGLPFWDTQCGFKAFRMNVCRPVLEGATIDRFGFDVELLYVTYLAGLKLREVAVRWDHQEGSKIDFASDSLRMFSEVRRIRRQAKQGVYESTIARVRERSSQTRESPITARAPERNAWKRLDERRFTNVPATRDRPGITGS
jgi:dolichyl-phosphate beta-glucosyltransferase